MAAEPVPEGELTVLHQRIGRDIAALRRRWAHRPAPGRPPGHLVAVAVEMFRLMKTAQGVVAHLRSADAPTVPPDATGGGRRAGPL
ncbi:MAG: hypothetical protein QN120_09905 [Armatimonadota bacterium]|nr:hypothetical protein [Armatimonadota bacterium]